MRGYILLCAMFLIAALPAHALGEIRLISPADKSTHNNTNARFYYNATSSTSIANCSLVIGGIINQTSNSIIQNSAIYFDSVLSDGSYTWSISCFESSGNLIFSSSYNLNVDDTPPSIISSSPYSMATTSTVTLSATTNENATCRYNTSEHSDYNSMAEMLSSDRRIHKKDLSGLSDGTYDYYIVCEDLFGNRMTGDYKIGFELSSLPTAQISLSDNSPLKAGTIDVTVITSKEMSDTPVLSYFFDDPTVKQVSLTGSGSLWRGYIVIPDTNEKKVGTFKFSGRDVKGNTGTFITEGKLFIVDTVKPTEPLNVKAKAEKNGNIKIEWYYDDEDVGHYELYRSTESGVTYLDYYDRPDNATSATDSSTVDKVTYYYKVAVVDKAGNKGQLSKEVYATSVKEGTTIAITEQKIEEDSPPKVLPPNLVPKVDAMLRNIDNLLIDLSDANKKLSDSKDEAKTILNELKLIDDAKDAESKLNAYKKQLAEMKLFYKTEQELDSELSGIDLDLKKIKKTVAKDVSLLEKTEFFQSVSDEDIKKAIEDLALKINLNEDQKSGYLKKSKNARDGIKIAVTVYSFSIEYLDSSKAERTFVRKKFSHDDSQPLKDVVVIEMIPKEAVETTDDIDFMASDYEILKKDPVVKWGFLDFPYEGKEIKYMINHKADMENTKRSKSVVLLVSEYNPAAPVTGYSFLSLGKLTDTQKKFVWVGLGIITLLLIYYFLVVKSNKMDFLLGWMISKYGKNREGIKSRKVPVFDREEIRNAYTNYDRSFDEFSRQLTAMKADRRNSQRGDYPYSIIDIHSLINEAHAHLDMNNQNRAAMIYPRIRHMYSNLPPGLREEVYDSCVALYSRLQENE